MKLLGWMHRKFRQNSNEPFRDFCIGPCACLTGQSSLDDAQYHRPKFNYCNKQHSIRGQRVNQLRKSFASSDLATADEDDLEEEAPGEFSELFHGFLAIGTLGSDPAISDPSTPTFSISVENIMEKETEVTENELKLINDELEKVLGADESCNMSSGRNSHVSTGRNSHVSTGRNSHVSTGRNSHVSTGRNSHCSTITLSGRPIESADNNGNGTLVCPLQGYLLGSAVGFPETVEAASTAKKEHRVSLGELFQKTKQTEESYGAKKAEKDSDRSAAFLVKKLLKKKILHASNKNCMPSSGGPGDSASAETKLNKILHIFHRKVHPERSINERKSTNSSKSTTHLEARNDDRPYITEVPQHDEEDIIITPYQSLSKGHLQRIKSQSNPPQLAHGTSNSCATGEHWIKTDSDYLVLEL